MRGLIGILGRMVMVAVAAILIGGCLASPAAAEQRPEAKEANDFIDYCFRAGGDPIVIESYGDDVNIMCANLPGVGDMMCYFEGVTRDCYIMGPGDPGGVRPTEPVDTREPVENPTDGSPWQVYEVVPIWTLSENDGGTEALLRAAGGPSGRITVLGGSAVAPADEAAGSRVTLGESNPGPAAVPAPAPLTGEGTLPVEETDAVITFQGLTLPVEETDTPVTTELFPGEGTLPVEETDAEVTTETWEGTLPVEDTDAEVTTEPVPTADEQP